MKKSIIALIVAAVLIVSGGLLFFIGLQNADADFSPKYTNKVYTAEGSFQNIQIDTGVCDVQFFKTDGDLTVHCPKTEQLEYIVLVEDGTLRISAMDMRKWYDFIGISTGEMAITVYLPEDTYESLYVQTNVGDITIPKDFSFDTAEISTNTGDIDLAANVSNHLIIANSTGDIRIQDNAPALVDVRLNTGHIYLENMQNCGDISLVRTTGKVTANNVTCRSFTCSGNTGDTELTNVVAAESLYLTATTGEVELENCDAAMVTIETDTGDVSGHFLSPKWFITETSTGHVDVPLTREGGECHITTNTGDIEFH